jgi:hypothetical protein
MQSPAHTARTFHCEQRAGTEDWLVAFNDRLSFHSIASRDDLQMLCRQFSFVVLLGVFDWSNYSRDVFREMAEHELWFSEHAIGVGIVCLGNSIQLAAIHDGAYSQYMKCNTEPILFFIAQGEVKDMLTGPRPIAEIKHWVLLQRNSPGPTTR